MKYLTVVILGLIFSCGVYANEKFMESGFKAFKDGGANAAWPVWAKDGPLEGSKDLIAQASQFGTIGAYYGKYVSHDYISEKSLGESNKVIYVIMNMENGPLYGTFFLYKLPSGRWTSPNFFFHTQAQQVWPASVYTSCAE